MINYYKYINSNKWKNKSKLFITIMKKCGNCGDNESLGCHHKHYRTIGFETLRDIEVLCWKCHRKLHNHMGDRTELLPKKRKRVVFRGKRGKKSKGISQYESRLIGKYCIRK